MLSLILNAITWDVSPVIYTIKISSFELPITWYGLLFACGFLVGQKIMNHIFEAEGKPIKDVDSLLIYAVIGIVAGARIGHYLFYEWELLFASPGEWFLNMITPPFTGLASHGATIAVLIAFYLYSRTKIDQPFFWVVDRAVITVAPGGALIRIGNLINSEIYGTPTSLPWGFIFVRETDPSLPIVPRHPTGLYEAMFCLFLFGLTYYIWKTKREKIGNGFITGVFMILLFSFRFLIEFLKNNQSGFEENMALNMGQWLSIPGIFVGVFILLYSLRTQSKKQSAEPVSL